MMQHSTFTTAESLSIIDLQLMKRQTEKIACLTAYDASFSVLLDRSGVDVILVGDSLGMVIQGHDTTLPVTMEHMVYHVRCVATVRQRAFVIADMPFMSYLTPKIAALNAARLVQEGYAQMVKLEGTKLEVIRFLVDQGIPVCGHLGLLPQSINQLGQYKLQGKAADEAAKIVADAKKIEQAGATMLVLECIPAKLARQITEQLDIPVIGIGAGVDCDGQVLVLYDMLDISVGKRPRFSRNFIHQCGTIEAAIKDYVDAVKTSKFPALEHSY